MDLQELALEHFFSTFSARLLHESSVNNSNKEHFFIAINSTRFLENNPTILKYVKAHQSKHTLLDISTISLAYIDDDKSHSYLWIGSMMKDDPLFVKRMNYLKNNTINHLSIMWLGKPFDKQSHYLNQKDIRLEQVKGKAEEIKNDISDLIKENAPILKNKIKSIKSLIKK